MNFIADILLAAGAIGAGLYCIVLGRRLNRFNDLESGVGGAVAVLSAQVDDLNRTMETAQKVAGESAETLTSLAKRAEDISRQLELQMASLHDLPAENAQKPTEPQKLSTLPQTAAPMFARRTQNHQPEDRA
ncbi:hypothetical protein [Sulfitobacter donghicola]|uniref:Uncharacterized protein n=1 Tax=Sulfitobacter donghicola DSW-25 = KCTC 12864 = JCM 14565 TaxID=1300350 RepID=A0A073IYU7_9RHOB|nr:hypothetical protein [Sulfitobacter donghicola]KEJ90542.1 hypothetical protein DSW25_01090 [Sulfitobacter donghicola DSW-25 = KCTC 12864 = JCM 14565]KIN67785.1 hypothetical protein Z948_1507 [Sulfitobacter donghicola DSW-25 = KCTC 12864 = JCM 14565]